MGSSVSCDHPSPLSGGPGSCLCSPVIEKSCVKYEQLACNDMEKNTMQLFVKELESDSSSEEDANDSIVEDVSETMQISDHLEPLSVNNLSFEQETISNTEAELVSLERDAPEGLNKHSLTFCSELSQSFLVDFDIGDGSPSTVDTENFHIAENLALEQPLPAIPPKLVSALKGSRAQQGMLLDTKLSVKWSPEVYDPPVSSSSHTVKGHLRHHHHHHHHHHSKAKKDHHKQPSIKGKSSKGSVSDRKPTHRSSSSNQTDPRTLRLERPGSNRPVPNSCGQSKVEHVVDLSVRSDQIIEFGGSCYIESLPPVQLPVAKAS